MERENKDIYINWFNQQRIVDGSKTVRHARKMYRKTLILMNTADRVNGRLSGSQTYGFAEHDQSVKKIQKEKGFSTDRESSTSQSHPVKISVNCSIIYSGEK